jgi:hypothetical protein
MNSATGSRISCTVEGAEKLPSEIGGEEAVCAALERAAAATLRQAGVAPSALSVSVNVRSAYRISAVASLDGKTIPEQQVGISDRELNARAIDMLAQAVAAELGKARE